VRLGIYTDYVYRRSGGTVYAERAFALFASALSDRVERLVLIGRLAPSTEAGRYALPDELELAALPYYETLARPGAALASLAGSLRTMWRMLDELDTVWILGPYPHAIALALIGWIRRRSVILGVRQDWPRYVRMRRPNRRLLHLAADAMENVWRALARRFPVVVVGSDLREHYAHAPALFELIVSLVPESALLTRPPARDYRGDLVALSVGRLDPEKNPLLMPDIVARLPDRWRLHVVGEGDLAGTLAGRTAELELEARVRLLGYVPMGDSLFELYRRSHALLHVSWTEGFPQVLVEAFATGLPVVATAVGGVSSGVGDAALLVPPGDAEAAAAALVRLADDDQLRQRLIDRGLRRARELTREAQTERLLSFLSLASSPPRRGKRAARVGPE
jgi:glycosyltransferase involved in cell wall biosynthesis